MRILLGILALGMTLANYGCGQGKSGKDQDDSKPMANKFGSPAEAFEAAKQNLPAILNENQKKSFDLASDDEIKALTKTRELPISYLSLSQLKDTAITMGDEGYLYGLGTGQSSKICISVTKHDDGWMQNTVGMKQLVTATNTNPSATRLIDVPALQISLLELADSTGKMYAPVKNYAEADITQGKLYSKAEVMSLLENYRAALEKKYGADFSNGNLEK